ncbi:MAG: dTDP-4-dehydrorhamnose 3,5-epimerase [Solirubrobacterales bacterium]|nr:dTDP-4-dehydrorhamnose 3,5-epimerase [Solirubrobacterales bacterium]
MIFEPAPIAGAFTVRSERVEDERGHFARTFCADEFGRNGLEAVVAQCAVSFNRVRGTLRGLHLQAPPHAEAKLVRCAAGAIYDVVLDLRAGSPTFREWWAIELTASSDLALYVPRGVAHGFQTLEPDTEVTYQLSQAHAPEAAGGVRWDDPAFGIEWPLEVAAISAADRDRAAYGAA